MMYWRCISVFSCASFSHSNFRLNRKKAIVVVKVSPNKFAT